MNNKMVECTQATPKFFLPKIGRVEGMTDGILIGFPRSAIDMSGGGIHLIKP